MFRYKLVIEYDGTNFVGWQKQLDSSSIQSTIESAIFNFSGEKVTLYGAGRTDSGVHALGQIAHFDLKNDHSELIVTRALNHFVRPSISIIDCVKVGHEFHARFSAIKRAYKYIILNRSAPSPLMKNKAWHIRRKLNISLMIQASKILIGKHDFSSFRAIKCQAQSPIKTIDEIKIEQNEDNIYIHIEAPSFLHHMVRNIVGTLKLVGTGNLSIDRVKDILEAKDRSLAGMTAPACGLYFTKVTY